MKGDAEDVGLALYHISEVINAGIRGMSDVTFTNPEPDTVAMFCYTSGTTDTPKAAKLTHGNFIGVATAAKYRAFTITPEDTTISYLPLAHSFEQMLFVTSIACGARIGYFSGNIANLTNDCQALQPTLFPSVPRVFNRIHDKI